MSGHSKWHNIQGRKNAQDAKRGKYSKKFLEKFIWQLKQVDLTRR